MKKKNLITAFILAVSFAGLFILQVIAGATFDYGELAGAPPAGEANWFAWHRSFANGTPREILTEDQTNCELGENIGYSEYGDGDINTEWWIQIENFFVDPVPVDPYYPEEPATPIFMIFGGLGTDHAGTIWKKTIQWIITESTTDWGVVPVDAQPGSACPIISEVYSSDGLNYLDFEGAPGYYHVYRSQNASGAGNGASNGQYFYLKSVTTDANGRANFTDDTDQQSWYVVIQADPSTNTPIGCHSEPGEPTAIVISDLNAVYHHEDASVSVSWDTTSEHGIVGFKLLRSEAGSAQRELIATIDAENPGQNFGNSYLLIDESIELVKEYAYWLETIGPNSNVFGPATIMTGFKIYMPLLLRQERKQIDSSLRLTTE